MLDIFRKQSSSFLIYLIFGAIIVVFAIILARAEVFASKNPPLPSFIDGFGMGLGFLGAMLVAGALREVIGSGTFWGVPVFGADYQPILMVILAPGGFITIGLLIGLFRVLGEARERARSRPRDADAEAGLGLAGGEVSHV